jgi:hypothetical protein
MRSPTSAPIFTGDVGSNRLTTVAPVPDRSCASFNPTALLTPSSPAILTRPVPSGLWNS